MIPLLVLVAACGADRVNVAYRPGVGTTYRFAVDVTAETVTTLEGEAPQRKEQHVELDEEQTVLASDDTGVRVRVVVGELGSTPQAFIVRFDRDAQLRAIDAADGASPDLASAVGVPEIFPGAAGAPDRHVGPGTRWSTTRVVTVAGSSGRSTLRTTGRFVAFAESGGHRLAKTTSTTRLPLRAGRGSIALRGTETIEQHVAYDVSDGSVFQASATTTGRFTITVRPPAGTVAAPVSGTLTVTVRSTTTRQR